MERFLSQEALDSKRSQAGWKDHYGRPFCRLRSLHLYMEESDCDLAIRLYAGTFSVDKITTSKGKEYRLLNIPYYLAGKLDGYANLSE